MLTLRKGMVVDAEHQGVGSGGAVIRDDAAYVVVDGKTGEVVYRTTYKHRSRARRWADRKDNEWGAYRYFCRVQDTSGAAP